MNARIVDLPPLRVAFIRHVGPYGGVRPVWDRLCAELGSQGLLGPDTMILGLCHDDPILTTPDLIRYDACATVDDDFEPYEDIGVQVISGGDYAVLTHVGPYGTLSRSYRCLIHEWIPHTGRNLREGPCFEVYLNTPDNTAPGSLLTEIHVPLEPAASP